MSNNWYIPKKSYSKDINLIRFEMGAVLHQQYTIWLTRPTEYKSALFPIYPNSLGSQFFTHDTLNRLEIVRDIRSAGLEVHHINLFFQKGNSLAELHIDDGANPRHASLNLPIRGCEGSEVVWVRADQFSAAAPYLATFNGFDVNAKPRTIGSQPADPVVTRDDSTWDIVDRASAGQPILLKTDEWHAVDNRNNPHYRWLLGIRFVGNPHYEEVLEKLQAVGL